MAQIQQKLASSQDETSSAKFPLDSNKMWKLFENFLSWFVPDSPAMASTASRFVAAIVKYEWTIMNTLHKCRLRTPCCSESGWSKTEGWTTFSAPEHNFAFLHINPFRKHYRVNAFWEEGIMWSEEVRVLVVLLHVAQLRWLTSWQVLALAWFSKSSSGCVRGSHRKTGLKTCEVVCAWMLSIEPRA